MKRFRQMAVALAATVAVAACGDSTGTGDDARVRFVNATASAATLDFSIDGRVVAPGVAVNNSSECRQVNSGFLAFRALRPGSSTTYGPRSNQQLAPQGRFSLVVAGPEADARILFLSDLSLDPLPGRARLRVINGVPNYSATGTAVTSNVFVTEPGAVLETPKATAIGFGAATHFMDVPAGNTVVTLRNSTTPQNVTVTTQPFAMTAGQTVNLVIGVGATPDAFHTTSYGPCS